jgi:hypothetical protein
VATAVNSPYGVLVRVALPGPAVPQGELDDGGPASRPSGSMGPPIDCRWVAPSASQRARWLGTSVLIALRPPPWAGAAPGKPSGAEGAPATTAAPAPTAAAPTTSEPVVLADGRHPVYLKTVEPDQPDQPAIKFDLIQFFTGEAATKAAAEDGKESPPPNDYYIRNVNSRLRTLPVRSDAPITVNVLAAQSTDSSTKDLRLYRSRDFQPKSLQAHAP